MNQRIQELDKQAKIWAMENATFPISSHIPSGYITKFAELIVRECAELMYGRDENGNCKDGDVIKEHFGVEE